MFMVYYCMNNNGLIRSKSGKMEKQEIAKLFSNPNTCWVDLANGPVHTRQFDGSWKKSL